MEFMTASEGSLVEFLLLGIAILCQLLYEWMNIYAYTAKD